MANPSLSIPDIEIIVDENGRFKFTMSARWAELVRRLEDHETRITALEP